MTALPPNFKKIRLHLAKCKEFPEGSTRHGYEFIAPLDDANHIDVESWKTHRAACVTHHFWPGEVTKEGLLVHRAGGAGGATWLFDYDKRSQFDDEAGYRFGAHPFVPGEYVSIRDEDGELRTFVVAGVSAV
jgi:hypothetical protein